MSGHKLKERFPASAEFKQLYEGAYRELYQKLYASGAALTAVDQIFATIKTAGANASTVDSEAGNLRTIIENRTKSLATNEVITRK